MGNETVCPACMHQASKSIVSIDFLASVDRYISIKARSRSISIEQTSWPIDIDRSQVEIESIVDQIDHG